ncbi:MAG: hypothetical protein PHD21_05565 [Flavobacteriales bacterium]|nr:hypothetical protein [Flavobacteriales bacterium]
MVGDIVLGVFIVLVIVLIIRDRVKKKKKTISPREKSIEDLMLEAQKQSFLLQFPRRKQILEESMALIQNSNNINVLVGRYNDVVENYNWIIERKNEGMPVIFNEESCGFISSLNRAMNFHIIRVAKYMYDKKKQEIGSLKTKKAKENRCVELFELIEKCKKSLKNNENKDEAILDLDNVHYKIEELYSKISM